MHHLLIADRRRKAGGPTGASAPPCVLVKRAGFYYDGAWHSIDLATAAGAPAAASGSGLSVNSIVVNHPAEVYYVGTNSHIYSVWQDSSWHVRI
ncbi:MAG TPA: hypothetical protein VFT22_02980 [Kofleriaceae bacterium]|nr:hypothetical protein [Kofleriaceae bacterium]